MRDSLIPFRLKPLDVAFMKAIHNKVNIVPVIAKADTLTLKERERLKKRVCVLTRVAEGQEPGEAWACVLDVGEQAGSLTLFKKHLILVDF